MTEKPCIQCGHTQPLSEYYTHPRMSDGRLNKCKACCRQYARRRHYVKMQDAEWRAREQVRSRAKSRAMWAQGIVSAPREMSAAKLAAARAVPRVPVGMERHHWSYNREHWTDLILLQIGAHRALHRHMTYDPASRYFRTPRGHLLNTKRKHVRWLLAVLNDRDRYMPEAA